MGYFKGSITLMFKSYGASKIFFKAILQSPYRNSIVFYYCRKIWYTHTFVDKRYPWTLQKEGVLTFWADSSVSCEMSSSQVHWHRFQHVICSYIVSWALFYFFPNVKRLRSSRLQASFIVALAYWLLFSIMDMLIQLNVCWYIIAMLSIL